MMRAVLPVFAAIAQYQQLIVASERAPLTLSDSKPTGFASCICQKKVPQEGDQPVILVTKKWELDECTSKCKQYCQQENAPFRICMPVHTESGNTGNKKVKHLSEYFANVVPDQAWQEEGNMGLNKMVRHESYISENAFMACSCSKNITEYIFLVGQEAYMGGLQVWGRTGCGKSCSKECYQMGFPSSGCIQAEMTKGEVGEMGYKRESLSASQLKRAVPNKIQGMVTDQLQKIQEHEQDGS